MQPFDEATNKLEALHRAHLDNIQKLHRTNVFQVTQSFQNYMDYARKLSGLDSPAGSAKDLSTNDSLVLPVFNEPRSPRVSEVQIHDVLFKDSKKMRRKENIGRFKEFLHAYPLALNYKTAYWKMMFNEPISLDDIVSLSYFQIMCLKTCFLFRYKVELDVRFSNKQRGSHVASIPESAKRFPAPSPRREQQVPVQAILQVRSETSE